MLHIHDLSYRIGGRLLFSGASAHLAVGHRVGLVGRNGAGKSTLLKLIAGELAPEGGEVALRAGASLATLSQEAPGGRQSLLDFVLAADRERSRLLAEAEGAQEPLRIAEIHTRLADIGAERAPARAAAILAGLGFDRAAQARMLEEFSGGWRMRVALAAALFAEPDLLLLDEPSNHLDLEATLWLEGFLATYPRTFLLVSHDRDLLNRAVGHILHLDQGRLTLYAGGYDGFERLRREGLTRQTQMQARQEAQRRHLQAFVDRFRAKASKARQAQSRLKMLARLEPIVAVIEDESFAFRFPAPQVLAPPLLTLDGVSTGYEAGKPILSKLDLRIDPDDRIALLGANGNGKSTLAKLLCARLQPLSGTLRRPPRLQVGYFAQHQADELLPDASAFEHLRALLPDLAEAKIRARLGRFGFTQAKADVKTADLSGGEKARLLFALMSAGAPQVLILDEPTNHLDVDARAALVEAINEYEGAVILISHDRHLLELCADRLWLVEAGRVQPFEGDLADYARLLATRRREAGRRQRETGLRETGGESGEAQAASRKDRRRAGATNRAQTAPLRRAVRAAEAELEQLALEKTRLEAELADPVLYAGPAQALTARLKRQAEIAAAIAAAEQRWLEAHEALEAAEAEADA